MPGEFPPVFPGTTTTLARLFGRSQRHFASNSGNFRANSAQFVTDSRGRLYRPRLRLFRPAGRLLPPAFPARRRPPRAARLPGRTTSRASSGEGPGRKRRTDMYSHGEGTTGKINTRHHLPGAPITIVLRAVRVYKSGSSREGLFRALPAHSPGPGVPVSAGIRKGVRNSWRRGMAAGSSSLAAVPRSGAGPSAAGAATGWPRGAGSAASWRHRRCRHDRAERGGGAVFSVRCPGLSGGDRGCRQPTEAHPSRDARLPFRVQGCGILSVGHRRPLPGGRAPCLGRAWSRHGDGSVAGGAGSSPEGGAAGGAFQGRLPGSFADVRISAIRCRAISLAAAFLSPACRFLSGVREVPRYRATCLGGQKVWYGQWTARAGDGHRDPARAG